MDVEKIKGSKSHRAESSRLKAKTKTKGLSYKRYFSREDVHPFEEIEWENREALISNEKGETIFSQKNVEVPRTWSVLASTVVVSKYFRGQAATPQRETSVKQLITRVAKTISQWGQEQNYFAVEADKDAFESDMIHLLVNQKMAFNSPVWFNLGVEAKPQCSACFINSVDDTMPSILDLVKIEGMLFKGGSGSGTNLSNIRSSRELLSGGGQASGPVSFMKGFDAFAGVIKSGGKTRRAAKMVLLNIDHPDIVDFIQCKAKEEKKAWALIDAGYDGSFTGEAYASVFFQNSNNSVRVSDAFMKASENNGTWSTLSVRDKTPIESYDAKALTQIIAEAAWLCGDPGLQFDTTINAWHTCPNTERIHASNPCAEYMFLNDSACNLASLNLMKFVLPSGELDIESFEQAIRLTIVAQEIMVDKAAYPTDQIGKNSRDYRPLGLGYANLGALLMSRGLPYDSAEGRAYAAALTALLTAQSYKTSAQLASDRGAFAGFAQNREPMLRVIAKHSEAASKLNRSLIPDELYEAAKDSWVAALELGRKHGYRNAQVTVLAPTGTIGFMMDCDTTGIEPDIALVKYKKLVGGGYLKLVNSTVPMALKKLAYPSVKIDAILKFIEEHDTIEGAPELLEKDLAVFDCAFKPSHGKRAIHYLGHLKMMAAAQPFISGAISKTVNVPHETTAEEIAKIYLESWEMGLKAVAVYRDGCKRSQPLNTSLASMAKTSAAVDAPLPQRRHLPDERQALTHKFTIAGHEGYITVGLYEDGSPGELFLVMSKEGTVVSGLMDSYATAISLALQYGVPLKVLIRKFSHTRFEPSGFTQNKQIPFAKSVVDYIFRWLASKFMSKEDQFEAGVLLREEDAISPAPLGETKRQETSWSIQLQADAPPCSECGSLMIRNGVCYKCVNCGTSSGCS